MPTADLDKIAENDLRKLHAEVNQIVSQRFSLTTASVVAFATACGWASTALKDKPLTPHFISNIGILILCILFGLYLYFMLLLGKLQLLTIYIAAKYQSPWELDWKAYRMTHTYWGYTKAGTFIFQLLGTLSFFFLGFLWLSGRGPQSAFPHVFWWPLGTFLVYQSLVYGITRWRDIFFREATVTARWNAVIHRDEGAAATSGN